MQWLDDLWGSVFGGSDSGPNYGSDPNVQGPPEANFWQRHNDPNNTDTWNWRDVTRGLAQAGQAAGADNRYLPPGLAIGAFGSGLTQGMDTSQDARIKLQMQRALQSAQAQNLLASADLSKAQAGAVPSTISETVARAAYTQALTAGQPQAQALQAAQAALAAAETQQKVLQNQRQIDSDRQVAGLPPINRAGSTVDNFSSRLAVPESGGNLAAQNTQGYSGQHQFGAPRLQELGFYTPAAGEIVDGKWNGKWGGQFNIPGSPDVKTINDFLKGPNAAAAQNAVFANHVNDIDNKIRNDGLTGYVGTALPDGTPVTMDGMRAAAHLGGYQGMKNYIMSGGKIDPADANGTRLSTYMNRFAGAPSVAAPVQHTPAQLAIMGGGGAAGGGMGGITAPGFASPGATTAPAPSPPVLPGGGFGARAGAPLTPAQSVLSGGGDVLGGMPQPVPGSPGAPAVFAGPGAPPAPLNPQQAVLNSGGFVGPGLEGGGGPMPNLGGTVARSSVPPVASVAPTAPVPPAVADANTVPVGPDGTNRFARLSIPEIIRSMPSWMQNSLAGMDVNARNKFIADFVEKKATSPFNVSGAQAAAAGFGPFNDNAVIKITPSLYGPPQTSVEQPGVSPEPVIKTEHDLYAQFTGNELIKSYELADTHLNQIKSLAKQYQEHPTAQLSAALIIEIGKMIAPQAVRGVEQTALSQASGIPGLSTTINQLTNSGGKFAVDDIPAMLKMVDGLHNAHTVAAAAVADQFRTRAESYKGVNADNVINKTLYPRDLAERAAKGATPVPPLDMTGTTATTVGASVAKPAVPAEPVKSKYTADWAKSFETPQALDAALLALKPPDLMSIPQAEVDKMTPQQRDVLTGVIRKRTLELMPAG